MRALVQRVTMGRVSVNGRVTGQIGNGLVVLAGVGQADGDDEARHLASKIANLRIFADANSKFNLSALDVGADILVVSQFTLYADVRRGRRPGFTDAARPEIAERLCDQLVANLRGFGLKVETGEFQQDMLVEIHNSGPVTIWLDTDAFSAGPK